MMTRKELDLWVGIFAVIGIGALLFLSLKVANLASFSAADFFTCWRTQSHTWASMREFLTTSIISSWVKPMGAHTSAVEGN